uniref:Uncharacterized protein n=1 Tax=Anguilla anguilla TaxID=7936 RepID=A0A0E9T4E6_ANGAN
MQWQAGGSQQHLAWSFLQTLWNRTQIWR